MGKTFRKQRRKRQGSYKMRGCGGGGTGNLAYTGEPIPTVPNPFLAYTGRGGAGPDSACGLSNLPSAPTNINASNPALPNTGPVARSESGTIFNNAAQQLGGCGTCGLMRGGVGKGCNCSLPFLGVQKGGNPGGIPYANGLVGQPWTPKLGDDAVGGNHNYYPNNTLNTYDVSRQMVDVGANRPFLKGGRKGSKKRKPSKRRQRGGTLSNFLSQDLINLGRQFQFGVGSAYNALAGYPAPMSPLPWKDQFSR